MILDFDAFDAWYEEDERNVAHPRDPFHRDRRRAQLAPRAGDGRRRAAWPTATAPYALFEPPLPVRYYLAPEDVRTDLLEPSDKRTFCAYKGEASYWSLPGAPDVAWSYPQPLREAAEITGRIAFFDERVDLERRRGAAGAARSRRGRRRRSAQATAAPSAAAAAARPVRTAPSM